MRNEHQWRPTKFMQTSRGLRASRDARMVAVSSRFIADILASQYEQAIREHARGRLLDLGCGYVPLYAAYRQFVESVFCTDWETTLHPCPYLDFTANLSEIIPLADSSFDTVVLTDVLEHIPEPSKLIGEIARILTPAGKLIAAVPFFYGLHEEPFDFYRYTEHALRRLCDLNHLRVLRLEPYGGMPDIFLDLTSKGIAELPASLSVLLRPLHTLSTRVFYTSRSYRRFSKGTASSFPLGYLLVASPRSTGHLA